MLLVAGAFFATGISELLTSKNSAGDPALPRLVGVGWIAAGVAVVVWAGSTINALAIVTGISMVLRGLTKIAGAVRGGVDDRVIAALAGAASVIFGVLALSWPDITVLILGLLVGPSTVIFGLGQVLAAAIAQDTQRVWRRCLGGVWGSSAYPRSELTNQDLDHALRAAEVIGDDYLQRAAGEVVDSALSTQGSSQQRQHWVRTGYQSGRPSACDTFAAR